MMIMSGYAATSKSVYIYGKNVYLYSVTVCVYLCMSVSGREREGKSERDSLANLHFRRQIK